MTNERTKKRVSLPAYSWLPRGAEVWSAPVDGRPNTWPRLWIGVPLIWSRVPFGHVSWVWAVAASVFVTVIALAAWPLRRRGAHPDENAAWVWTGKSAVRLIRPVEDDGPAVVTQVRAVGGTVLGLERSAAAVQAARRLLTAAEAVSDQLQPIGHTDPAPDDEADDEPPAEICVVLHDAGAAFVLEAAAFYTVADEDGDDDRERQRAVLARAAAALGAEPPVLPGRGGRVPEEALLTADDLRTFADGGFASAQRLEREFTGQVADGPSDIALEFGRVRAWPSRVDAMTVGQLAAADPAKISAILRDDLAAQAATDRAREQRDGAATASVTDEWERRWHLYLERYAARPAAGAPSAGLPPAGPRSLTPTARAALLLAVTATDITAEPLRPAAARAFGLGAEPAVRRIPWPRYRGLARAGDRILLALTIFIIPFVLVG